MEISIEDITNYIDFLMRDQHLNIALHGDIVNHDALVKYNIHPSPYCWYIKVDCHGWSTCMLKQQTVMKKCKDGEFFGVCYAGVGEFDYPVMCQGEVLGYISVSGYKNIEGDIAVSKLKHYAQKNNLDFEVLEKKRQQMLKEDQPEKKQLDTLLHPLVFMLEAFCGEYQKVKGPEAEFLKYEVFKYVINNYTRKVTMQELCKEFHYSVSSLSHMFKKQCGMSLNAYIEHLRMDKAKLLLENSDLSITDISYMLGFCNPNYFSAVFRRKYQMSPKDYRKSSNKRE